MNDTPIDLSMRRVNVPYGVIEILGADGTVVGYAVDESAHHGVLTPSKVATILKAAMVIHHGG
jgi:hypothetical protein